MIFQPFGLLISASFERERGCRNPECAAISNHLLKEGAWLWIDTFFPSGAGARPHAEALVFRSRIGLQMSKDPLTRKARKKVASCLRMLNPVVGLCGYASQRTCTQQPESWFNKAKVLIHKLQTANFNT